MANLYDFKKSNEMFEYAKQIIPGGVQASRRPFVPGLSPVYMVRGKGARCWDVDGNEFIDYTLSLGPVILGYAYPRVNEAVAEALKSGVVFTNNHPVQNELAEKLRKLVPSAEMSTFFKSGSDATSAAVRIARTYAGREKVARCGYHGWHDWCCPDVKGVPKVLKDYVFGFDGNKPETLEAIFKGHPNEIACVIIAPETVNPTKMKESLLAVQKLAHDNGAVFILDEVKTGFRIALGGLQEYVGVTPDMTTVSKAMANGFPLSAVLGKKEIMEASNQTHISATFNGEFLSLVAAVTTIQELEDRQGIKHIWRMGERLLSGLNDAIKDASVSAEAIQEPYPPMPVVRFRDEDDRIRNAHETLWFRQAIGRGILVSGHVWFISLSHGEAEIDKTIEVLGESFKAIKGML